MPGTMIANILLLTLWLGGTADAADQEAFNKHMQDADTFFSSGDMVSAETAYRQAAGYQDVGDSLLSHNLGMCLAQQGRAAEAITSLEQAVALSPSSAALYLSLANVLVGQTTEATSLARAIDAYEKTLQLDPSNVGARNNLHVARSQPSINLNETLLEALQIKGRQPPDLAQSSGRGKIDRAIIVEPRNHPALEPVIDNICSKLGETNNGKGVPITLVHGSTNGDFARGIARRSPCVDQVLEINAANLDYATYSKLFVSPAFWRKVGKASDQV
jgi:tetratricopeptide (TPR) repeat protein